MIEIVTASKENIVFIESILQDAAQWLREMGQPIWRDEQVSWAHLSKDYRPSDFYLALFDGIPAACMGILDYDPTFWPNIEKGKSLYIHKLAVKRFAAGHGLADALIAQAKSLCRDRGISSLRLDCPQDRPYLHSLYQKHDFVHVGEVTIREKYSTVLALYKCMAESRILCGADGRKIG